MTRQGDLPPLYNPAFEHDGCGTGFVASIEGEAETAKATTKPTVEIQVPVRQLGFQPRLDLGVAVASLAARLAHVVHLLRSDDPGLTMTRAMLTL